MAKAALQTKDDWQIMNEHDRIDTLDALDDAVAAAAFRRLVRHLQHRHDAQNIELMGLAGFCRNCLADWIRDAGFAGDKAEARELIHGMPADEWKTTRQTPATPEQIARMDESVKKNAPEH
jgi:hypothetical protein